MLKRYAARKQIRWVGKAWEIRHALRQELKKSGGDTRLAELFSRQDEWTCIWRPTAP